jgi:hypothetical protein
MTTIVVHGTLAYGGSWYQSSWEDNGFLSALSGGMLQVSDWHDVWIIGNDFVWQYPGLGQVFEWNGLPEGIYRGIAAQQLAQYLNTVAELADEPIRIVAHSHGCNVVKLASSLPELSPRVHIEQAVFLACPHFYEDEYTQEELSWQDRLDIRKVSRAYKKSGHRFRYRLDPQRFGRILNIYCEKDKVQVDLAQSLSGGTVPLTGSLLQHVMQQLSTGVVETPRASRWDPDENAAHLYENLEVQVERGCSGIKTHSVMHGAFIGAFAGIWLNSRLTIQQVLDEVMNLPVLPCDDTGA